MVFFKFSKLIEWKDKPNRNVLNDFDWSFTAILNEMRFYKYVSGRIIFLLGTSSAGKSSIVSYIKKNAISDPTSLKFTGTDAVVDDLVIDCFYKNSPKKTRFLFNQIQNISQIVEYIDKPEKFTLDNLESLNLKSKIYIRIKTILKKFHYMRDELLSGTEIQYQFYYAKSIITSLLQGKTIIVDTIELRNYFQAMEYHLIQCKKDTIVVYCPPKKLEEHIMQRNKIGIRYASNSGLRFFFPFEQYDEIYTPTMGGIEAVDQITLFNIQAIDANAQVAFLKSYILTLQTQAQYHSSKGKIWQSILSDIENIIGKSKTTKNIRRQQSLIDKWFSIKMNAIYIKPKVNYQMLLNSGTLTTVECGKKVLKVIDEYDFSEITNSNANKPRLRC